MAKKALCIGINDYPGTASDLLGCVNDAQDWASILQSRDFAVSLMLDNQATKANMVSEIRQLVSRAQVSDSLIITYSGHGTFQPDTNGDETDGRDEALCPYDIGEGNALLDDEIYQLFSARAAGVQIVLISDSCHSGTVIRWAPPDPDSDAPRARFLPPSVWMPTFRLPKNANGEIATRIETQAKPGAWLGALSLAGGDLLMAGCRDKEYSYDAKFGGRCNGAFSYYAMKTLRSLPAAATYNDWYKAIRNYLPGASYPQTPQLMGSKQTCRLQVLA